MFRGIQKGLSTRGEGIRCLGEGSDDEGGGKWGLGGRGSGGKGGGKWGNGGEGSGD